MNQNFDFTFQNGRGCRKSIHEGEYTMNDALSMLPFTNKIVELSLTGQELKDLIELGVDTAITGKSSGAFPYLAGLRFVLDSSRTYGHRVQKLEMNRRLEDVWVPLVPNDTYTVGTIDHLANGGDYYTVLKSKPRLDTGLLYTDAWVKYLKDNCLRCRFRSTAFKDLSLTTNVKQKSTETWIALPNCTVNDLVKQT